jgi:MFS transporter, DHA1 family, multidrug resistance protein
MVPLVPALSLSLGHNVSELQYLFSAYVIGLAVSQPIFGIVADRIGRRPILLTGFTVFIVASVLLVFTETLNAMIFLRFLQAVGVGVGTVVARGIIRDHLPPAEALKTFAILTAAMGFTPVIAPVAGGLLATFFGMKSVFIVLALLGSGMLALCFRSIPSDPPREHAGEKGASLKGYLSLLRSIGFWGHAGAFGFLQGMVFTLLATGSVLFQDEFGLSMQSFSFVWGSSALVYVSGSFLLSHTSYLSTKKWQNRAVMGMLIVSLSAPALILAQGLTLVAVTLPLFASMLLSGILTPTTMYGAVNAVPRWSGSAAGLSSSIGMTMAGIFSWLGASLYEHHPALIMVCFGGAGVGFVCCWLLAHRGQQSSG